MRSNFCLISGINYLAKAITMYESLLNTGVDFRLYYVAFDKQTLKCLMILDYEYIVPIDLSDIEDKQLKSIKKKRKVSEYYFTLTPSIILYVIKKFNLDQCIYLDADLYFFQSPELLLKELRNDSVMITRHHPVKNIFNPEGKYCVQFLPFKNDAPGMKILEWWRERCNEWCFVREEGGKWADQGYLNDWPERFDKVHILEHYGAVGPWNVNQTGRFFNLIPNRNLPYGKTTISDEEFPVVFYHFQGLRIKYNGEVILTSFELDKLLNEFIYTPYIKHLFKVDSDIRSIFSGLDPLGRIPKARTIRSVIRLLKNEKTLKNIVQILVNKIKKR